jgi:hypothetical protein
MAMDPKKFALLERKMLDHKQRTRIPLRSVQNAKNILDYVAAHVERSGDNIYISVMDEGPTNVHSLRFNAVAAMNMAVDVLEAVKDLFPDVLRIEARRMPPKEEQH